jgi:hypothetical protein
VQAQAWAWQQQQWPGRSGRAGEHCSHHGKVWCGRCWSGCSSDANLQLPLYRSVSVVCDVGRGMEAAIDGLDWRESAHVEEIQDSETSAHEHQDSDGDASVPQGGARSQAARKSAEEVTGDRPRDPLRPP